jgi:hypothetical protein
MTTAAQLRARAAQAASVTYGNGQNAVVAATPRARARKASPQSTSTANTGPSVTVADFVAYMPMHNYIFKPTGDAWPASSVDARMPFVFIGGKPMRPSAWLDKFQPVEQMTWAPGDPQIITDRLVTGGGWIHRPGCRTFNLYRPATTRGGNPLDVDPWLAHIAAIYPAEVHHIVAFLAHRVQRPGEKINHALVLGGNQGIGKDTLLEPVKHAVGPWNFAEVSPAALMGRFNGFIKSVILRVSEARDLGDVDRFAFYDHMKTLTAAPPDVLRCDEKNVREYPVFNVTGVVITTNHKADGVFIPPDDRRHFVAWSDRTKDDFDAAYWQALWRWYASGGIANVTAFLRTYDLSSFDAKAPPPKTEAWHEIVNANRAPEDAELADVLDACSWPQALTLDRLVGVAHATGRSPFADFLKDRRNRRAIPHRLETAGYVPVRNPDDKHDGQWRVEGKRQTVYARRELSVSERLIAARSLR